MVGATTTTEATLSAIHESLAKLTVTLCRIAARQADMLMDLKKTTAALVPSTTTMSLVMPEQAMPKLATKPSYKVSLDCPEASAAVFRVSPAPCVVAPTRCSTMGMDVNNGRNRATLASTSWGFKEAALPSPLEPSLDKHIELEFNMLRPTSGCSTNWCHQDTDDLKLSMLTPTTCLKQCCHDGTGAQEFVFNQSTNCTSSPNPPLLVGAEFIPTSTVTVVPVGTDISFPVASRMIDGLPDEVFTHVGGMSLFLELDIHDDASRPMPMVSHGVTRTINVAGVFAYCNPTTLFSVVPMCDNAEDVAAYGLFEEVLQRDDVAWKPWPPDLQVFVSHKKTICRPRPWPSFACNQLEDVQHMPFTRLPRQTPYLKLTTETLAMLKCPYTDGRHVLDIWCSLARYMEQWPFHDVVLGKIIVCCSIRGILGHVIKQMIARMSTCQSLIFFTNKRSFLPVLTQSAISFFHVQCLLASRLTWHLDPGGSRHAGLIPSIKNIDGPIKVTCTNLMLDVDVWEGSKSRILATELSFQWGLGIMLNALVDAIDRLVVSLYCPFVSSRLFTWPTCSLEANAKWGIIIISHSSQDHGYEFYSNQQSKQHCAVQTRGGFQVVFLLVLSECKLYPLVLKEMQYGSNITSFSLSWDPGGYLLRLICHASGADLEINHENDNSVGLDERQDVGAWLVLGKFPPWRLSCFRLEKHENQHDWVSSNNGKSVLQLYGIIRLWDPGISQAKTICVHPEIFRAAGDRLVLDMILPWDSSAFALIVKYKVTQSVNFEVYDEFNLQQDSLGAAQLAVNNIQTEMPSEITLDLKQSLDSLKIKDYMEEQLEALKSKKKAIEKRKRVKEAGIIGSTMDTLGGTASLVFLCQWLYCALNIGLAKALEDGIDKLVVSFLCTCIGSRLLWSTSSLEALAEWCYEFSFSQQFKLQYAKSKFLMWPSKYLLMAWDPCNVQNKVLCAHSIQSTGAVDLQIPWDPGIVTIHNAVVLYVSSLNCKLELDGAKPGRHCLGQAMFFGGGIVMPGTLR